MAFALRDTQNHAALGALKKAKQIFLLPPAFELLTSCFRIFSKNIVRRQRENQKFLSLISPITKRWQQFKCRRQQKNLFCFFKCPQCGMVLRVPKGKGHIRITCKGCGHIFERNS